MIMVGNEGLFSTTITSWRGFSLNPWHRTLLHQESRLGDDHGRYTKERKRGKERTLSLFFLSIISWFSFKDKYCGSQKLEDTLRLRSMAIGFHLEVQYIQL
ncbi:hypothetical protein LWI28_028530 [Acer negundo]|uniref:Uncharacterized protein n=1 Tax=Acer negundo TaxID=4023 RepID=A0AAD5NFU1_ACENE|nr:hypothetical protein LWI28_028530 [Acer negundo]